jgi:flagellar biosynthesis protein FlhF
MRIKTFYTKTMSEALRDIKACLGPDALLLSTKEIPRRSGIWGRSSGFEVVAASDHSEDIDTFSPSGMHKAGEEKGLDSNPEFPDMQTNGVLPEIYSRSTMTKKHSSASSGKNAKSKRAIPDAKKEPAADVQREKEFPFKGRIPLALCQNLIHCGVETLLARELVINAWNNLSAAQRRSRAALLRSVAQAAFSRIATPSTQDGMPEKRVVAFVGPTGVGKTTSIAKLAAHLALQKKKKVVLVTLDGYRIGAIEQLRSYAGLMGIPFRFAEQVSELNRVIEENRQRDYILIDTAGRSPRDMDAMNSLAAFLKKSETIERHLVLSASTKPSDMRKIMDQFEVCCPDHLLFTKLDETSTPGPIFNELVRTQKCFSYYTDGQKVPDDLHAVSGEGIIDIVLNRNENALKE